MLLDDATDAPEKNKFYTFEYDPKFRDTLQEWDEYPLIYRVLGLLGISVSYTHLTLPTKA